MKKVVLGFFAVLYLTASIGVTVDLHFCMGTYAGHEFFSQPLEKCGKCGMKEVGKNGCCHDEFKVIKVDDDQNGPNSITKIVSNWVIVPSLTAYKILVTSVKLNAHKKVLSILPPPDITGPPLFVKNRVFRI